MQNFVGRYGFPRDGREVTQINEVVTERLARMTRANILEAVADVIGTHPEKDSFDTVDELREAFITELRGVELKAFVDDPDSDREEVERILSDPDCPRVLVERVLASFDMDNLALLATNTGLRSSDYEGLCYRTLDKGGFEIGVNLARNPATPETVLVSLAIRHFSDPEKASAWKEMIKTHPNAGEAVEEVLSDMRHFG